MGASLSDTVFEYNSAYATVLRRIFVPTSASLRDLSSSRTPLPQGGALDLSSGGILSVPSSTFRHNSAAYGGAVGVGTVYSAGRVQISGSSFHNHLVTAMVGKDSQLPPESAFSSIFFVFLSSQGGVVYASSESKVDISKSSFENNHAISAVSSAYPLPLRRARSSKAATFHTKAESLLQGGALEVAEGSDLTATNSLFRLNSAYSGGAIDVNSGTLFVLESIFESNSAYSAGAVLIDDGTGSVVFRNSKFETNHAYMGGALRAYPSCSIAVSASSFIANSAYNGGAILVESDSTANVENAYFYQNSVGYAGGAICITDESTTSISSSSFLSNSASVQGGSINVRSESSLVLSRSTLDSSTATEGGAIGVYTDASANVADSTFRSSEANVAGGALYVDQSSLRVERSLFEHGSATTGSVIALSGSDGSITAAVFQHNSATNEGGALSLSASTTSIAESTFSYCSTGLYGGSVYVEYGSSVSLSQAMFSHSTAGQSGGAIHIQDEGSVDLLHATFEFNSAEYGGGIYIINSGGSVTLEATAFASNEAAGYGVDMFNDVSNVASSVDCAATCPAGTFNGQCFMIDCYNCDCYSCACALFTPAPTATPLPTGRPTALPTPTPSNAPSQLPTTLPTPIPSGMPLPMPTAEPTPEPTPVVEMTVAPETLSLAAVKPAAATDTAYLVNLNDDMLYGNIWLVQTTLPPNASWSAQPSNFNLRPGSYVKVAVSVDSAGLVPRTYNLTLGVAARTTKSLPSAVSIPVALLVGARADAATTKVVIVGAPTLDVSWSGIKIYPYDGDGYPITTDGNEGFEVALSVANLTASCAVRWSVAWYEGECRSGHRIGRKLEARGRTRRPNLLHRHRPSELQSRRLRGPARQSMQGLPSRHAMRSGNYLGIVITRAGLLANRYGPSIC